MRLIAAVVIIAAIAIVLALIWSLAARYMRFRAKRTELIWTLGLSLQRVNDALLDYAPSDVIGDNLAADIRHQLAVYDGAVAGASERKQLRASKIARAEITRRLNLSPPHLFRPDDKPSRVFLREAFNALHHKEKSSST